MAIRDKHIWDLMAQQFDKKIGEEGDEVRRNCVDPMLLTALQRTCNLGASVLDVGSGNGYFLKKLEHAGFRTAGFDISPELLRIARQRCPYISFYEGDVEESANFLNGKWDAVTCSFVLDGLQNIDAALGNLNRLLVSGGHMIINIPHPAFLGPDYWGVSTARVYTATDPEGVDVFLNKCTLPVKYYWRSVSLYLNAIIAAGFTICQVIEPDPSELDEYFCRTGRRALPAYVLGIVAIRSN